MHGREPIASRPRPASGETRGGSDRAVARGLVNARIWAEEPEEARRRVNNMARVASAARGAAG